jgi:dihydrodipicolinate synthase/N-acetylneuraminate lyase
VSDTASNDITKVVDQMMKQLEDGQWAKADRLQKVLEELVKIEVAQLEAGKL